VINFDVAVIGAGFAGLSAATALAEAGAQVIVLEARPGLGGRASAFRDPQTGEPVDNGQHILIGCYQETLRFLARIGASSRVRWQSSLAVSMIDRRGHESTLRLPSAPSPLHLVGGVFAWDALTWRERSSVLWIGAALRAADGRARRSETVREWLARHGQAPRLCELLWEPLALAALNQSIDHAAARHFVCVLQRMFGPDPAAASILLPAVPLDDLYAHPARDWLAARGCEVRVNAPAHVRLSGDRVAGVRVRDEHIDARVVISAVPWFAFPSLFDEPPRSLAETIHHAATLDSSAIVTVNLWFDRPIVDRPLIGLPGRAFQWVFDKGAIVGNGVSHLSLVSSGASALAVESNDALIQRALNELRDAVPAARTATLGRASAVREKRATFSLAPNAPPRPHTKTAVEGFLLAGDWVDTGLPATIESAVVSGHEAARAALDHE
jgi:squalene-associated FAD-dependent desaturase